MLIDTHCHIHFDYKLDAEEVLASAIQSGVGAMICVGTDGASSKAALDFAEGHDGVWAAIGLHPHDSGQQAKDMDVIHTLASRDKVVAVGEAGLDYFYSHSTPDQQKAVLRRHFEIASQHDLPMIFHVRGSNTNPQDAFDDFWKIYDEFKLPGVMHSFSSFPEQLAQILDRGLYVGVNGIATFTKDERQKDMYLSIPIEKMLLETDAPYLTPAPFRGTINEPKFVGVIAAFLSELRNEPPDLLAEQTSRNAQLLFGL